MIREGKNITHGNKITALVILISVAALIHSELLMIFLMLGHQKEDKLKKTQKTQTFNLI